MNLNYCDMLANLSWIFKKILPNLKQSELKENIV